MKLTLPVTALGCFSVSVSLGCGQTVAVPPRLLDAKAAATVAPQLAPANANLVIKIGRAHV